MARGVRNPPDIDRVLPLQDYIDKIDDLRVKAKVADMFAHTKGLWDRLATSFGKTIPAAGITVERSDFINANTLGDRVTITTALIDHCVNIKIPPETRLPTGNIVKSLGPSLTAATTLGWALSHEYTHALRNHYEAGLQLEKTIDVEFALEIDADLCAISNIYRWLQDQFSQVPGFPDDDVRCLALYNAFWGIRALPHGEANSDHPRIPHRIALISTKLATLNRTGIIAPDSDMILGETRRLDYLLIALIKECEGQYLQIHGIDPVTSIFPELCAYKTGTQMRDDLLKWEAIRDQVVRISGMPY